MNEEEDEAYFYNAQESEKMAAKPIYQVYKKWLKENGVLTEPGLIYPAYFGKKDRGVIGVATAKPLPSNHTIIAVPYDLIITVQKVKAIPELAKMIEENPNLFKIHNESAFGILALYICYQLLKKQKSFYSPYFAVADDIALTNWTHWDILAIENLDIAAHIRSQKEEVQRHFMSFLTVFRRYSEIFPQEISNTEYMRIFEKSYNFICTRAFGWSLPSISLIPMADSLNHNNQYVTHMLVDTQLELNPHQMYSKKHEKINLSLLSQISKQIPVKNPPARKKPKVQKFVEKHKQILQGKNMKNAQDHILFQQYKAEVRNLRQLHFYESSCEEDNDTDEEYIEKFEFELEKFRFYEKYESLGINEKNRVSELARYWKIYLDPVFEEYLDMDLNFEDNKKEPGAIQQEFLKNGADSDCSEQVSSSSSDDSDDEEFKWMAANPDSHDHKTTYFIMATRKPAEKHQQLFNFYGRRSNRFLLVGYNFVLSQNKYDSFAFRLCVDDLDDEQAFKKKQPTPKLIYREKGKKKMSTYFTKQIRIKQQRVCIELVNHCRALLIGWSDNMNKLDKSWKVRTMIPFDVQFQKKVLLLASDLVKTLYKQFMTSNEEDEELWEKCHKYENRIAIEMRMNYKNILASQSYILEKCQLFIKNWKNGRMSSINESDMKWIRKCRLYLCSLERGGL